MGLNVSGLGLVKETLRPIDDGGAHCGPTNEELSSG